MKITHRELDYILDGLSKVQSERLREYHLYREQDNEPAAQDCLAEYKKIRNLELQLTANKHDNGTEFAYELV